MYYQQRTVVPNSQSFELRFAEDLQQFIEENELVDIAKSLYNAHIRDLTVLLSCSEAEISLVLSIYLLNEYKSNIFHYLFQNTKNT